MSDLNFRIESSAKAYEILANNLYSDKVSAVIRELSCNAADAHTEAGIHEVPFEVDLPVNNTDINYFRVRDFGSGLNTEQIEDVFTVFFSSTKTGSKAYTGAFGLGCKSPFAIADNFFVNSYINGKKYYYHCHKQNNIPAISFMKEEHTNQKSGLEIIVPAHTTKSSEWIEKAANIFEHFKTRPKINIEIDYFNQNKYYKCGNNWENTEASGIFIVMNNVKYPLNLQKLDKKNYITDLYCTRRGIVYHVPPRSVEVTPSREGISYTKETVDFLNNYITKINKEFIENIQSQIQSCPTMLIAKFTYSKISNYLDEDYFSHKSFMSPTMFEWNGKKLANCESVSLSIDYKDLIEIGFFYKPHKYSANLKKQLCTNTEIPASNILTPENIVFIINDTKASQDTIKTWANRKFKKSNLNTITFLVVKEEYKHILTIHNGISEKHIIKCSTENLHKITSYVKKTNPRINIPLYVYDLKTNTIVDNNTKDEKDLISASADEKNNVFFIEYETMRWEHPEQFYMPIFSGSVITTKLNDFYYQVMSLIKMSKTVGEEITPKLNKIVLIKNLKKNKKFMKTYSKINKTNFVPFDSYFRNLFATYVNNNNKLMQHIAEGYALQCFIRTKLHSNYLPLVLKQKIESNSTEKENYAFKLLYFCSFEKIWEKYLHTDNDLKQIWEFLNKHSRVLDITKQYRHVDFAIAYLYDSFCKEDNEKMTKIIENNYANLLSALSLLEKIWAKYSIIFDDEKTKTEKIIELCLQGKTP